MSKTFEELAKDKVGTIYIDAYENGIRYIIMRGPASLCAYIGIPASHPLAGRDYDDIPLDVHGGLTFAHTGDGLRPEGMFWYGWDYGHSGDKSFYDLDYPQFHRPESTAWTVEMVKQEIWSATYNFEKLMKLVEPIQKGQKDD